VRAFALEYELIVNPVYSMPHLEQLLDHCRTLPVAMGIVSNAQFFTPCLFEWFLGARLEALGFADELLVFSYRTGHAKPSPLLFQLARKALKARGIQAQDVLFVGNDMLNDIYPARQAGFQTALFAGDQRSLRLRREQKQCLNLKPDLVITDLQQLCEHII
jgi:putative hydrolase of the HAD superfamily